MFLVCQILHSGHRASVRATESRGLD